ncbi:exodeoxyribonuclease VII large subunit [Geobacter sp. DSM 9736]|uniref:exodeoxyribonuclease VII large subunit n=1 Tax=Geobacter sp. DSM 9736 TaxID=1277350 RepID=UPI000B509A90|nr:exodeoxyribonuclease VII large subunit [Geobacter sp. DSM 9736]SNB45295.1 Exodeoxyribonuclease VII large subunit [Geobacter sp. DSM 9736]
MELFAEKRILTVSQLTSLIRGVLEENFEHVWVEGELSNCAVPASGHFYCTLRDSGAQLRCIMFKGAVRALRFRPRDGMRIIVRGRLTVYDQRGEYQLIAEYIEPQGIGALQMAFMQLKEKLAGEGLFEEEHKKSLPKLPQRIGIVTSPTGAAIHDILHVLNRRFTNVEILIRPVRVQGEGAAAEIAEAIEDFNRYGRVDVMIVGRGGGSLEDLWSFNEEVVARAIYRSTIPVISAVGHEVDFTIADFVADLRAPTPSAAAELVVRSKAELTAELESLEHRLGRVVSHSLRSLRGELKYLSGALKDPTLLVGHAAQRLDDLHGRLQRAARTDITRRREGISAMRTHLRLTNPALHVERGRELILTLTARSEKGIRRILEQSHEAAAVNGAKLHALSPLLTLARGYAVARRLPEGSLIIDSDRLTPGDRLDLRLHRGGATCVVEEVTGTEPPAERLP